MALPMLFDSPKTKELNLTRPTMPDTPELLYSELTSPASSVLPQTLVGMIDDTVKTVLHKFYPGLSIVELAALNFTMMKQKMFSFAAPSKSWSLVTLVFYPIHLIPIASSLLWTIYFSHLPALDEQHS
jgi:hypothetical protein